MFLVGLIVGGCVGFVAALFFVGAHSDDDNYKPA